MNQQVYDAILLVSFGGPEGPDDVLPFLRNVTRGRDIPEERLKEVGEHYFRFGGKSPINDHCRSLIGALETLLAEQGPKLPVYWGNRNWHPLLADTVKTMRDDGIGRAIAVATSAYSSYSSCRQYIEDIERARTAVGDDAPLIEKIPPYYNHPGFIETMADNLNREIRVLPQAAQTTARVVFTAHSIPMAMADRCRYEAQLREASQLTYERSSATAGWELCFQSRSGPPSVPWLEPDICTRVKELAAQGTRSLLVVPIGFLADHMEVIYDLDTEAAEVANSLGVTMLRVATVGSDLRFVHALRDLVTCHAEGRPPATLGDAGARPFPCETDCCPAPSRPRP